MAVTIHPSSSSFCLPSRNGGASQPSLCCATKVFIGLRPQSSSTAGSQISPNLSAQFYDEVHKRVQTACKGNKPTQGRARMMPIGTPKSTIQNSWREYLAVGGSVECALQRTHYLSWTRYR